MKTAMQALRDDFYAEFKDYEEKHNNSLDAVPYNRIATVKLKARMYALRDCYKKAAISVETEKQQIMDARVSAPILNSPYDDNYTEEAEQYYKEKYGRDN